MERLADEKRTTFVLMDNARCVLIAYTSIAKKMFILNTLCAFQKAGCDGELDSAIKRDECGICGGDGTKCRKLHGSFNEPTTYGKIFWQCTI